jgi:hypothetical protein
MLKVFLKSARLLNLLGFEKRKTFSLKRGGTVLLEEKD